MFFFLILIGFTMLISLGAQVHVKRTYAKYSQVGAASGATGAEVASAILQRAGIQDVEIAEINETLGTITTHRPNG